MPEEVVVGVGAVAEPTPPEAEVYHNKLLPVAESEVAVAFWQYVTGDTTTGGDGNGVTVTSICARALSQPLMV